jgi:hypothetical protein
MLKGIEADYLRGVFAPKRQFYAKLIFDTLPVLIPER